MTTRRHSWSTHAAQVCSPLFARRVMRSARSLQTRVPVVVSGGRSYHRGSWTLRAMHKGLGSATRACARRMETIAARRGESLKLAMEACRRFQLAIALGIQLARIPAVRFRHLRRRHFWAVSTRLDGPSHRFRVLANPLATAPGTYLDAAGNCQTCTAGRAALYPPGVPSGFARGECDLW